RRLTKLRGEGTARSYHTENWTCVHCHGLVWADRARLKKRLKKLPPGLGGAPGAHIQDVYGLSGWITYAVEDPRSVENRVNRTRTPGYRKGVKPIGLSRLFELINLQHDVRKPDICFTAGYGDPLRELAL